MSPVSRAGIEEPKDGGVTGCDVGTIRSLNTPKSRYSMATRLRFWRKNRNSMDSAVAAS
jgi:hypothetical protein